jgi:hypothetical protein
MAVRENDYAEVLALSWDILEVARLCVEQFQKKEHEKLGTEAKPSNEHSLLLARIHFALADHSNESGV